MKIVLYVLAAIGAFAVIAVLGMFLMHGSIMCGMIERSSPTKPDELEIATRSRHVFLTTGGGKSWKQIAGAGGNV